MREENEVWSAHGPGAPCCEPCASTEETVCYQTRDRTRILNAPRRDTRVLALPPMAWNVEREHLHESAHSHLTEPVHGRREIKRTSPELVQRARNCRAFAECSTVLGMPSTSRLLRSSHRNLAFLECDRQALMCISTAQVSVA